MYENLIWCPGPESNRHGR